jgi:multidrug efflux pump subunit AcrA (membrane-fusion protein)
MTTAIMESSRLIALSGAALLLAGCLPDQQEKASIETPATPVTTVQATAKDTPVTIEFVGKTACSRRVEIRSRVEGFLASREYQEGTLVRAGQVIFQMDRKPFEAQLQAAQAELAQQQAKLANAEADLARVRPLANKKAVAKKTCSTPSRPTRAWLSASPVAFAAPSALAAISVTVAAISVIAVATCWVSPLCRSIVALLSLAA